jgi:hypothetical protein
MTKNDLIRNSKKITDIDPLPGFQPNSGRAIRPDDSIIKSLPDSDILD